MARPTEHGMGKTITYSSWSAITHEGRTLRIREWAKRIGIREQTLAHRLRIGWSVKDALTKGLALGRSKGGRVSASRRKERACTQP